MCVVTYLCYSCRRPYQARADIIMRVMKLLTNNDSPLSLHHLPYCVIHGIDSDDFIILIKYKIFKSIIYLLLETLPIEEIKRCS